MWVVNEEYSVFCIFGGDVICVVSGFDCDGYFEIFVVLMIYVCERNVGVLIVGKGECVVW